MSKAVQRRRELLFDTFSHNLNYVKTHPFIQITPDIENSYMCPMCYRIFARDSVTERDILTLDHIPSEKLGGKDGQTVLLCKKCNNDLGSSLDKSLYQLLMSSDFVARIPGSSIEGWYSANDIKMTATIGYADDGSLNIFGHPKRTDPKKTNEAKSYIENLPRTCDLELKMGARMGKPHLADIACLRYAYLMLFRLFGYAAIFYPEMMKIRDQIVNPNDEIIPRSWIISNSDLIIPDDALGINLITEPLEAQSFLVVFDLVTRQRTRQAVILPKSAQPSLQVYDWLLAKRQDNTSIGLQYKHLPEDLILLTDPSYMFHVHSF